MLETVVSHHEMFHSSFGNGKGDKVCPSISTERAFQKLDRRFHIGYVYLFLF